MARGREILFLDPNDLQTDTGYVRKREGDINGLATTIKEFGVLEPLGVRKMGSGYRVVYGGRRRKAAIVAGVDEVPCIEVPETKEEDYLLHHLVENLQRRALGDMEQAEGLARLRRRVAQRSPNMSEPEIDEATGAVLGYSARTVQRYLALRELAADVRDLIAEDSLSVSQAQHLRVINEPARQAELARLAVELDLPANRVRDAAQIMSRRKGISAEEAIHLVGTPEGNEVVATANTPTIKNVDGPTQLVRERATAAEDNDLWDEEPADEIDALIDQSRGSFESNLETADGNRVRRIKTIDSFCDEVDRLSRCVEEGDLAKAAARNPEAAGRLRLALKQISWLQQAVEMFLTERGWNEN